LAILNEETLSLALGVTGTACAAVFVGLSRYAERIPGPVFWAASFACIAFGFGSYFVHLADWRISALLWNIPTSAGPALLLAGMARFYGGRRHDRLVYGLIGAGIVASVVLSYVWPDATIRIAALGSIAIAGYIGAALTAANAPVGNVRLASRLLAATFLADAASLGMRVLLIVAAGGSYQFRSSALEALNSVAWLTYLATAVISAPLLVLLVAAKLRADLDEERLRAVTSGRKSRALFDAAVYASSLSTHPGGILVEVNEAWMKLFGYVRDEVVGRSLRELGMNLEMDAQAPEIHALEDSGDLRDLEWELVAKDGKAITCLLSAVRLSIDGADYSLVTAQDISLQRQLERALLESASLAQERLGRDLHDGLGQELTGISLLAAALASAERNAGRPADQLDILVQLARSAVASCRAMAHGLLPLDIPDGGIVELLQELVDLQRDVYGTNIRLEVTESAPLRLRPDALEALYRLAQEAVANARQHSRAESIRVRLDSRAESVRLEVCDDGVGIAESAPPNMGMGLRIMQTRAHMIDAKLSIGPGPNGGTLVCVEFPQPK
jgi:PAS domain S-box-containing protein